MTVESLLSHFFNETQDHKKTYSVEPTPTIVQKKEDELGKDFEEVFPENKIKEPIQTNSQRRKDVELSENDKKLENEMEYDDYGEFDDDAF